MGTPPPKTHTRRDMPFVRLKMVILLWIYEGMLGNITLNNVFNLHLNIFGQTMCPKTIRDVHLLGQKNQMMEIEAIT